MLLSVIGNKIKIIALRSLVGALGRTNLAGYVGVDAGEQNEKRRT